MQQNIPYLFWNFLVYVFMGSYYPFILCVGKKLFECFCGQNSKNFCLIITFRYVQYAQTSKIYSYFCHIPNIGLFLLFYFYSYPGQYSTFSPYLGQFQILFLPRPFRPYLSYHDQIMIYSIEILNFFEMFTQAN